MKVIITSPSLDPAQNIGGISSVTQFIIQNNKSADYIHFELGKKDNESGGIKRMFSLVKSIFKWKTLLSAHPDAIVHYNFPLSRLSILRDPLFIKMAVREKHPVIVHLHGGVFLTAQHIPIYLKRLLDSVFALSVPFVVLSSHEKEILQKRFNCRNVFVLPNCVSLDESDKFKRVPNKQKALVIGYIGRITETKGMDYLLDACCQLKQNGIPFMLKLAGKEEREGEYLPHFREKLEGMFVYEGVVSGERKTSFLESLDIFILPSFFEGLPMSLIECMSFGVVPVTTNVGSIGEVVNDGSNGLFIECKDTASIVKQIVRLNADRQLLQRLSEKTKSYIKMHFSVQAYIDKLDDIYTASMLR